MRFPLKDNYLGYDNLFSPSWSCEVTEQKTSTMKSNNSQDSSNTGDDENSEENTIPSG